ncbi:hypothetical protein FisN_13Hh305 [Fistulifera solaris]|jgi:hypothetical protein|uniref:Uncharacterized protein n=1 Tax=Fistulifera solaris TaxID=1519565 RepID=A0A1Z5KMU6_FISSO|nr:hypothetical protein FisN_13Hh305 [Fistulifera solaris]|eukprot:GAX27606.1 hypothetical protein FisN_13Hh305 [Fistulifera solaris]
MNSNIEISRTSAQPQLREKLSHEFRHAAPKNLPSPLSSPVMRGRKNLISSMLKTSFHSKNLEDHTAQTESSSGSDASPTSPRKKGLASSMHSLPTKAMKLFSEKRSISPLKIKRYKQYSSYVNEESVSNLALQDASLSLELHPTPNKPLNLDQTVDGEESVSDDESVHEHGARRTFHPYGHYMINPADPNTMWVSSAASVRPHLELNITRDDSPSFAIMRCDSPSRRRRRPMRSKSLRFGLKEMPRKDVSPSKSPRRSRRRSSIE